MLEHLKKCIVSAGVLLYVCGNVCAETANGADLSPVSQIAVIWYLTSFLSFFLVALMFFIVAYKHGAFKDLEKGKYYMLTINEPDYYTPAWAKEEQENESTDSDRRHK
jgi:hypothetical protein